MRHKGLKLLFFILLGFGIYELEAQSIQVSEISGNQTTYSLNNIQKLCFSEGTLIIDQLDNSSDEYMLSNIDYLCFPDSILVHNGPENPPDHFIRIYPNPVNNILNIDLSGVASSNGKVNILNAEGRLVKTQHITAPGVTSIDISHLPGGIYICLYSSETETTSVKIIKQ